MNGYKVWVYVKYVSSSDQQNILEKTSKLLHNQPGHHISQDMHYKCSYVKIFGHNSCRRQTVVRLCRKCALVRYSECVSMPEGAATYRVEHKKLNVAPKIYVFECSNYVLTSIEVFDSCIFSSWIFFFPFRGLVFSVENNGFWYSSIKEFRE